MRDGLHSLVLIGAEAQDVSALPQLPVVSGIEFLEFAVFLFAALLAAIWLGLAMTTTTELGF